MPPVQPARSQVGRPLPAFRTRLCAVAAFLFAGAMAGPASAYCRLSTGNPEPSSGGECFEDGEFLRWRQMCVSYSVVARDRAPLSLAAVRDTIDRSFETWMDARCDGIAMPYDIRQTEDLSQCEEAEHNERGGNVNTIAFLTDWVDQGLPEEAFGLTLVWHDRTTGRIVGADMLLNDGGMGRFANCGGNGCGRGDVDLQNVVTHEAGHFLGLGHSKWRNAAMYWQARPGEVKKRHLDADDLSGLCSLYGDREPVGKCSPQDFVPPGGFAPRCGGQAPAGCACRMVPATREDGGAGLAFAASIGLLFAARRRRRHR